MEICKLEHIHKDYRMGEIVTPLKDVTLTAAPFGIPEFLGCAVVALLHIWKRSTLLSIGVGTVVYMLLVQLVF